MAQLRPHVPPVRDAVRRRLAGQERQRLRLHDGHPGRPGPAHRGHGVQLALRRPRARATPRFGAHDGRSTSTRSCRSTASTSPTGGATGSCPRCSATSSTSRRRLDAGRRHVARRARDAARGRDRHPRPPLEDPLDAQLRAAVGDPQPAGGHGEGPRRGRRGAARTAPELRLRPQLGLDRGAVADEERGPRRPRAAGGVRGRRREGDRGRAPRPATAAGGSSTSGSSPTSASSAGTPCGATSSSSRRFASRWSRCSSWSAATSTPTTTTRRRSTRCAGTSRRRRRRSSMGSRARRSTRCAPPTRSTCGWRRSPRTTTSTSTRARTRTSGWC